MQQSAKNSSTTDSRMTTPLTPSMQLAMGIHHRTHTSLLVAPSSSTSSAQTTLPSLSSHRQTPSSVLHPHLHCQRYHPPHLLQLMSLLPPAHHTLNTQRSRSWNSASNWQNNSIVQWKPALFPECTFISHYLVSQKRLIGHRYCVSLNKMMAPPRSSHVNHILFSPLLLFAHTPFAGRIHPSARHSFGRSFRSHFFVNAMFLPLPISRPRCDIATCLSHLIEILHHVHTSTSR